MKTLKNRHCMVQQVLSSLVRYRVLYFMNTQVHMNTRADIHRITWANSLTFSFSDLFLVKSV